MPVLKLPEGGLTACNRNDKNTVTESWGDFDDDDWVPYWELEANETTSNISTKESSTLRRKRELEKEEGLFAPLFSKNCASNAIE